MNDEHTSRSASTAEPLWKLAELASHVAVALSAADVDQASGRVRDVPNARTIRYYTTLGLVDRPAEFRGRTAYYNRRHLLQLVAIKRLQARGMTLETIQERLLGLTSAQLARIAQLPEVGSSPQEAAIKSSSADTQPPSRRHTAFGAAAPTPIPEPSEDDAGLSKKVRNRPTKVTRSERRGLVQGVRLTDDVMLLIDDLQRDLDEDDREALRVAAAPLLNLLTARRLRRAQDEDTP